MCGRKITDLQNLSKLNAILNIGKSVC